MAGRTVTIPQIVDRVICSGAGCLRLLTYLQGQDLIVAVDSIEVRGSPVDLRPYAIANPQFRRYPVFGEFRGQDNPELIATLNPRPQVILKIHDGRTAGPDLLQAKTGIPVVVLKQGDLTGQRVEFERALRLLGGVLGKQRRAEEVIAYVNSVERDLRRRTQGIPEAQRPSCYVGGVARSGPHGLQSTEPGYAPFVFTGARNVAAPSRLDGGRATVTVAKEQIVFWDPDVIFVDVATTQLGGDLNALKQLQADPAYRNLKAVRENRVFGVFPYNSYSLNFEVALANAYFVGKTLYPERFRDVDPLAKAEEICTFFNGAPAFAQMNRLTGNLAFHRLKVR
ncbi:MAG: iron ABC transporter substrate-binding protein [Bryobacteraceae bacterium]